MSVYYAGPNANTIIPVTSSGTGQKYALHTLQQQQPQQNGHHTYHPYSTSTLGESVSLGMGQPVVNTTQHSLSFQNQQQQQQTQLQSDQMMMTSSSSEQHWSWKGTTLSVISMLIFVSFFGFLGLLFSIFAYADHKAGDLVGSRRKRQWAWCCAAVGMVITVMGAIAVVLVFVVFYDELENTLNSVGYYRD